MSRKYVLVNPKAKEVIRLNSLNMIDARREALELLDCYVEEWESYQRNHPGTVTL